jgi:Uma2 family endonuclease
MQIGDVVTILIDAPESLACEGLPHKRWTRDEVAVIESTGIFDGAHFELIDGELIDKMGKGRKHVRGTRRTAEALETVFGREFVDREAPIDVAPTDNPRNEPEPDVHVLRRPTGSIDHNPRPEDIALIVEVADTTLRYDMTAKAALYARAGIAEYWILDLNGSRLLVFRDPVAGRYQTELAFTAADSISPLESPASRIAVSSLLP